MLAAALCQFVMIGLIGMGLFVVALVLLAAAGIAAGAGGKVASGQGLCGLTGYGIGVSLLLWFAIYASSLAYDHAVGSSAGRAKPSGWDWIGLGVISLLPALLIGLGLKLRARWQACRCVAWGAAVFCVMPAAVGVFWVLAPILPLTT